MFVAASPWATNSAAKSLLKKSPLRILTSARMKPTSASTGTKYTLLPRRIRLRASIQRGGLSLESLGTLGAPVTGGGSRGCIDPAAATERLSGPGLLSSKSTVSRRTAMHSRTRRERNKGCRGSRGKKICKRGTWFTYMWPDHTQRP